MAISMHRRHDISDALWNKPEPHLSGRKGSWRAIVVEKPDYEWLIIDASHIKVHPHVAGAKSGNQDMNHTKRGSIRHYIWPWMCMVYRAELLLRKVALQIVLKQLL